MQAEGDPSKSQGRKSRLTRLRIERRQRQQQAKQTSRKEKYYERLTKEKKRRMKEEHHFVLVVFDSPSFFLGFLQTKPFRATVIISMIIREREREREERIDNHNCLPLPPLEACLEFHVNRHEKMKEMTGERDTQNSLVRQQATPVMTKTEVRVTLDSTLTPLLPLKEYEGKRYESDAKLKANDLHERRKC